MRGRGRGRERRRERGRGRGGGGGGEGGGGRGRESEGERGERKREGEREGKRLISTQLASRLGVTRSAVSQIVNRMEQNGVVQRVADALDRKVAYIVMTDETMQSYQAELKTVKTFIGKAVKSYGVEKFNTLCEMMDEFLDAIEQEKKTCGCKDGKKE